MKMNIRVLRLIPADTHPKLYDGTGFGPAGAHVHEGSAETYYIQQDTQNNAAEMSYSQRIESTRRGQDRAVAQVASRDGNGPHKPHLCAGSRASLTLSLSSKNGTSGLGERPEGGQGKDA